jgi:quinol monooxygenase YgiN
MRESPYVVIWEFQVKQDCEAEFRAAYGADGEWAELFRRSPEFLGVELVESVGDSGRFFTFDHWTSVGGFESFCAANAIAYETLDRRLRGLTEWERQIGAFSLK